MIKGLLLSIALLISVIAYSQEQNIVKHNLNVKVNIATAEIEVVDSIELSNAASEFRLNSELIPFSNSKNIELQKIDDKSAIMFPSNKWAGELETIKRIAITGSNGKTTVKELIYAMFRKEYSVYRSFHVSTGFVDVQEFSVYPELLSSITDQAHKPPCTAGFVQPYTCAS